MDVYFKPDRIICEYCGTDNCRHVEFALKVPKVREILSERLAEEQENNGRITYENDQSVG